MAKIEFLMTNGKTVKMNLNMSLKQLGDSITPNVRILHNMNDNVSINLDHVVMMKEVQR